jgi:hypothetical protein
VWYVSVRPLVLVSGLTVGDYILWNWSLNSSHDVLALVSGLTLPPLGVAVAWLLVLSVMRLLARHTRLTGRRGTATAVLSAGRGSGAADPAREEPHTPAAGAPATGGRSSGKLAA